MTESVNRTYIPEIDQMVLRQGWLVRATGSGHYDALLSMVFVAFPIVLCLGVLLFETVEKPFLQLRPRYVSGPPRLETVDGPDGSATCRRV